MDTLAHTDQPDGRAHRTRRPRPDPPPPGAAWTALPGVAGLLGVSVRQVAVLRATDPTFPAGRRFGRGGALRFSVAAILAWADAQPAARWSTIGAAERFKKQDAARS